MIFGILFAVLLIPFSLSVTLYPEDTSHEQQQMLEHEEYDTQSSPSNAIITQRRIRNIYIVGNKHVTQEALLQRIPYTKGEIFTPSKAADLIKKVYTFGNLPFGIGYFKFVQLNASNVDTDMVDLYISVQEKYQLEDVVITGDKHLPEKDLKKKIDLSEIPVIDDEDVKKYVNIIRKLYWEKNYHQVKVTGYLDLRDDKATMHIDIDEGRQAIIKRVFFKGNKTFTEKKLRSLIFTREDWVLSFLDKAGTYQPEAVESDKHTLENFYQSHGFINAKVVDVAIDFDEASNHYAITFEIEEGDLFVINEVHAPGNHIYTETDLLAHIPLRSGQLYSKELIRESIEALRNVWGEHGYIYADIVPSVQPNEDTKTVDVTFYSELGSEVYVNRITVLGNKKTRDRVIRRNITLSEGDLLTTRKMEESKERVELLGYFNPRDGVSWRMLRNDPQNVDLELVVKEEKTGKIYGQVGFGGNPTDIQSPSESFNVGAGFSDTNLLGLGILFNLTGNYSKQQQSFALNITEPWLFDYPVYAAFDAVYKHSDYEDFKFTQENIKERLVSGSLALGFLSEYCYDTKFVFQSGLDDLHYHPDPVPKSNLTEFTEFDTEEFKEVLRKRFTPGTFVWLNGTASQDVRNHPLHPSRGYQWVAIGRVGFPGTSANVGFVKLDFDFSWYTPLINERDLVFCFHMHAGHIHIVNKHLVPYRELYNIGGPASVRGFEFGEIGPAFKQKTSLGGRNAFWLNAELVFPINNSFTMKGAVFYDGGAGWSTPYSHDISPKNLDRNGFNYRHSVGIGVRLLNPTPVKLDWGIKLDRKKGEHPTEAHLTMYHNF